MAAPAKTIEKQSQKIADSAQTLEATSVELEDSADRRTELAGDRTMLAAERTYGAWVRTGLLALASGLGAKAGLAGVVPEWMIIANGSVLVLFSVFCFGAGVWRNVNPYPPPPRPDTKRIHPLILVVVNGFLIVVSLAALFGIWFGRTGGAAA
jgi:putative membrane protein